MQLHVENILKKLIRRTSDHGIQKQIVNPTKKRLIAIKRNHNTIAIKRIPYTIALKRLPNTICKFSIVTRSLCFAKLLSQQIPNTIAPVYETLVQTADLIKSRYSSR